MFQNSWEIENFLWNIIKWIKIGSSITLLYLCFQNFDMENNGDGKKKYRGSWL